MKKLVLLLALLVPQMSFASECVILLHGLMRSSSSMSAIEKTLRQEGYFVVNVDYPSTTNSVQQLADAHIPIAMSQCPSGKKINFVTHSMGGILVRAFFKAHASIKPNRVVMIAPPNQGSEVIDDKAFRWFGGVSGEAGRELGTASDSLPNQLGPVEYEVGVIAGSASINPIFSDLIPGPDDGAVAVERTHVKGESDWILVRATHSFIQFNPTVRRQVTSFLKNGQFES